MTIDFLNTKDAAGDGIKILVYGTYGAGKTYLTRTLPHDETFLVSAEAGLLSLNDVEIAGARVTSIEDVHEIYEWLLMSEDARRFSWIAVDSLTEIAEVVLSAEKKKSSDARQAYGALIDSMGDLVRAFRDLPGRNVYMSAKQERIRDEFSGGMLYGPMMPGSKLGPGLPHLFDEVMCLRVHTNDDGEQQRALQTQPDTQYGAKDRSGKLDAFEPPDLGLIAAKIRGEAA